MLTQDADQPVHAFAQILGMRPVSRGNVALFTDSFRGIGAAAAKRLVRDGYTVRLYLSVADGNPRA
jgi:hypothetical protein